MELSLINKLIAKPGKRSEVIRILLESAKPFQENDACLLYLVHEDQANENAIWVEDLWTDKKEHEMALAKPELQEYVKKAMPLLEGMPEQISLRLAGGKGPGHSL
jgi:quinol monooxygenase YgiN